MIAKNMENELWLKSWKATDTKHAKFIVGRWYHRPEFELYDTAADPWELTNLAGKKGVCPHTGPAVPGAEEMDARAGRSGYRSRYGTKQTGEPPRTKNRSAMKRIILTAVCGATAVLTACTAGAPSVETAPFGRLSSGEEVTLYRLRSGNGASMEVIDYGCRVVRICVPDRNGVIADIVPGYDDIRDFETGSERFFGALIGRYGNRIANASFPLDGDTVRLTANECLADVRPPARRNEGIRPRDVAGRAARGGADRAGVRFTRLSPDGEEGYPGNLACTVTYWFTKDNVWRAEYEATTDRPTIVNLEPHLFQPQRRGRRRLRDGSRDAGRGGPLPAQRRALRAAGAVGTRGGYALRPAGASPRGLAIDTPQRTPAHDARIFGLLDAPQPDGRTGPGRRSLGAAQRRGSNSGPRNPAC